MTAALAPALDESLIQAFRARLRGRLIQPHDHDYDDSRRLYNAMIDRRPALIARCAGAADVIEAVGFARRTGLVVAVRGGGHNVTGNALCEGGIVIDLSSMKGLRIDPAARLIRAEAGLTWGEVNHDLQAFGLAACGGYVSTTGVAGLTLGGGLGWLVRKHGLACDNLVSADVVTADGRLLVASETSNQDLFWGIRGGGGNFGIVTSFEFRVHAVDTALAGLVIHPMERAADVLAFWRDFTVTAPEELTSGAILLTAPPAPFVPQAAVGTHVVALYAVYAGPVDEGERVLRPVREFGQPVVDIIQPMLFSAVQTMADDLMPSHRRNYWKSSYLQRPSDAAISTMLEHFAHVPSPLTPVIIEHNGDGAMNRIGEDETAFGHRGCSYNLIITSIWADPEASEENIRWTRALHDAMQPHTIDAVYVNYLGDEGEERVRAAYGESKYERLAALKNKYDASNFFRLNQNIPPTE